jgi:Cytochrome P460
MKRIVLLLIAIATMAGILSFTPSISGDTGRETSPIYGVAIPARYRDWKLISVSEIAAGDHSQLRAEFGNDIAIKAFQEGKLPFPDGTIIAAQHWTKKSSPESDKVLTLLPMVAGVGNGPGPPVREGGVK